MNEARCRRLIAQALATFDLNLSGLRILTEAATGSYVLTPLIAALAGAEQVDALTRDSRFGSAKDVYASTMALAARWGVDNRIQVLFSREAPEIGLADVVTNLGFVRPLDKPFLHRLKPTAVIPLMWETWEYRPQDLDLGECQRLGIPVLGTNEHHPDLQIFRYVGHLAIKLLFETGIEVFRSRVVVVGSGEFGDEAARSLHDVGAQVYVVNPCLSEGLRSAESHDALATSDALVVIEHHCRDMLIGPGGQITAKELYRLNPGMVLTHITGEVNRNDVKKAGIICHPDQLAPAGFMSVATDYLGPRPLIDLHAAGLRVGQAMAQAVREGYSGVAAEEQASTLCSLAQKFT